jgi:hypothetical protein
MALALFALWVPAVAHGADALQARVTAQQRSEQIAQMIGAAACADDSECRVIGIGARACGGPESFAAWSISQTDPVALQQLVERDAEARLKELEGKGIMSTCVMLPVPGVRCVRPEGAGGPGGRCALQESRTGSPAIR